MLSSMREGLVLMYKDLCDRCEEFKPGLKPDLSGAFECHEELKAAMARTSKARDEFMELSKHLEALMKHYRVPRPKHHPDIGWIDEVMDDETYDQWKASGVSWADFSGESCVT